MSGEKNVKLPANNVSQQLFYSNLPDCNVNPEPCCTNDLALQSWYNKTPKSLWNTATNYEGGPGFNSCTDTAFFRQCLMSQRYNYISNNNKFTPK